MGTTNTPVMQQMIYVIGHLSFALTFLSYSQTSLIRLRFIALAGLVLSIIYNGWTNYYLPSGSDINLVLFWLVVFFMLNGFMLLREIYLTLEIPLPTDQRILLTKSFPTMHSRDWLDFFQAAEITQFERGQNMLAVGRPTVSLSMMVSGHATEQRVGTNKRIHDGTMWGELTFVMGENLYNASPVDIICDSDCKVANWPYDKLKKMSKKNLRFAAALQNGFVQSAGLKHGLLANPELE